MNFKTFLLIAITISFPIKTIFPLPECNSYIENATKDIIGLKIKYNHGKNCKFRLMPNDIIKFDQHIKDIHIDSHGNCITVKFFLILPNIKQWQKIALRVISPCSHQLKKEWIKTLHVESHTSYVIKKYKNEFILEENAL